MIVAVNCDRWVMDRYSSIQRALTHSSTGAQSQEMIQSSTDRIRVYTKTVDRVLRLSNYIEGSLSGYRYVYLTDILIYIPIEDYSHHRSCLINRRVITIQWRVDVENTQYNRDIVKDDNLIRPVNLINLLGFRERSLYFILPAQVFEKSAFV